MNMQQLMQQAKKMQADIEKKQKELEGSTYEGKSSLVDVVINGKKEIVKILNECKYCVLYDMQTAYAPIAALCGCIPIQIPEQGKTRKDYCGSDDASYGIAYGKTEDEINWALKTRDKLIERYKQMNINDLKKIDRFISVCMEHFDFKN